MPESVQTSRERLLAAAKSLFSRLGYEQTSTAAIAREAETSESQLVRYFGGKSGLLEALFNQAWAAMEGELTEQVTAAAHGREALVRVLETMTDALVRDRDAAALFLFEGRRIRGREVVLSKGFVKFLELLEEQARRGRDDGSLRTDIEEQVISSAALGCIEGLLRDRMIAERSGSAGAFELAAIKRAFEAMVAGLG
jgi:AcrR family transcriptional regulator